MMKPIGWRVQYVRVFYAQVMNIIFNCKYLFSNHKSCGLFLKIIFVYIQHKS